MLAVGVENVVKIKTADARKIPFSDNYFDAASPAYMFHNIHLNRKKIISEMIKTLQPRGILVIVAP